MKEWFAAGQMQKPGFSSGIEELQVLLGRDSPDQRVLLIGARETICAVVVAEQVERPVCLDVESHPLRPIITVLLETRWHLPTLGYAPAHPKFFFGQFCRTRQVVPNPGNLGDAHAKCVERSAPDALRDGPTRWRIGLPAISERFHMRSDHPFDLRHLFWRELLTPRAEPFSRDGLGGALCPKSGRRMHLMSRSEEQAWKIFFAQPGADPRNLPFRLRHQLFILHWKIRSLSVAAVGCQIMVQPAPRVWNHRIVPPRHPLQGCHHIAGVANHMNDRSRRKPIAQGLREKRVLGSLLAPALLSAGQRVELDKAGEEVLVAGAFSHQRF